MSRILKPKNKMNMKNLIKYGFIAVVICFCFCSCDSNKERRNNFTEDRIVTDSDGNKWIVRHNIGDNYILQPMPKK
jgi:hypothetical protein